MVENSRRIFLKTLAVGMGSLVFSPLIRLKNALGGELAKASDPLVKALGYVNQVDSLKGKDAPKWDKKSAKPKCANCQFYGDKEGKAIQAKCQLIASGEVMGTGWCRSYAMRPGAKAK